MKTAAGDLIGRPYTELGVRDTEARAHERIRIQLGRQSLIHADSFPTPTFPAIAVPNSPSISQLPSSPPRSFGEVGLKTAAGDLIGRPYTELGVRDTV